VRRYPRTRCTRSVTRRCVGAERLVGSPPWPSLDWVMVRARPPGRRGRLASRGHVLGDGGDELATPAGTRVAFRRCPIGETPDPALCTSSQYSNRRTRGIRASRNIEADLRSRASGGARRTLEGCHGPAPLRVSPLRRIRSAHRHGRDTAHRARELRARSRAERGRVCRGAIRGANDGKRDDEVPQGLRELQRHLRQRVDRHKQLRYVRARMSRRRNLHERGVHLSHR